MRRPPTFCGGPSKLTTGCMGLVGTAGKTSEVATSLGRGSTGATGAGVDVTLGVGRAAGGEAGALNEGLARGIGAGMTGVFLTGSRLIVGTLA